MDYQPAKLVSGFVVIVLEPSGRVAFVRLSARTISLMTQKKPRSPGPENLARPGFSSPLPPPRHSQNRPIPSRGYRRREGGRIVRGTTKMRNHSSAFLFVLDGTLHVSDNEREGRGARGVARAVNTCLY